MHLNYVPAIFVSIIVVVQVQAFWNETLQVQAESFIELETAEIKNVTKQT